MAKDPYTVLGVQRGATDAEIQKAFRRLAKKSHPDLFPGDKKAEDRFKELNAANDLSDLFGGMFGGGARGRGGPAGGPPPADDVRYSLEVDFADAATGAKKRITLPGNKSLDIAIPAGINDGQTIRLKGQGGAGPSGTTGDALVEVKI